MSLQHLPQQVSLLWMEFGSSLACALPNLVQRLPGPAQSGPESWLTPRVVPRSKQGLSTGRGALGGCISSGEGRRKSGRDRVTSTHFLYVFILGFFV